MSLKINAKTVRETLEEHLSCDAEIVKATGEMFAFYVVASSGSPLALAAGIGLILSAAASAIKGISQIIKRVHACGSAPDVDLAPYEQFRVIFYAACLQAYFDAGCPIFRVLCERWDSTNLNPWDFDSLRSLLRLQPLHLL